MTAETFIAISFLVTIPVWLIGYSFRLRYKAWFLTVSWIAFGMNAYSLNYKIVFFGSLVISYMIFYWRTKWKHLKPKKKPPLKKIILNPYQAQLQTERAIRKLDQSYVQQLSHVKKEIFELTDANKKLKRKLEALVEDDSPIASRHRMDYYANQSKLLRMKEQEKLLNIKEKRLREKDLFDSES